MFDQRSSSSKVESSDVEPVVVIGRGIMKMKVKEKKKTHILKWSDECCVGRIVEVEQNNALGNSGQEKSSIAKAHEYGRGGEFLDMLQGAWINEDFGI